MDCAPKREEPPKGLEEAPLKPPKPAGVLAEAVALLKLNGAALAGVPPNADPLRPPKLKAELLAAPKGGVEAAPPKDGVLKPANSEEVAAGWLCGAALALAKLKAEEDAPKSPVGKCQFSEEYLQWIIILQCYVFVNCTWCAPSKNRVGCSKLRGCGRARCSKIESGCLDLIERQVISLQRIIQEHTRNKCGTAKVWSG